MTIGEKIRMHRKDLGLTQTELGERLGVKTNAVSKWECGRVEDIPMSKVKAMAVLFDVPLSYLIDGTATKADTPRYTNIIPIPKTYKVPLVGDIACGKPILAVEEADETVDVPDWLTADFALRCKGDSMINARIFDGDVVFIRHQDEVETGQIAAVRIDDMATLKKVYYTPDSDRIVLRACNPLYGDLVYEGAELEQIEILGLAVGFYSDVRHEQ